MEQLYYKSFGSGTPLFILHGLLGSGDNWHTLAKRFAEDYQVIIPDARNHGRSFHDEEVSFPLMAGDTLRLMEQLNINQANFIGHSMGGKSLMYFTNENPDKVLKQIIVDIAPKTYNGGHEYIFSAMEKVTLDEIESRSDAENLISEYITDPDVMYFILKNLKRTAEGYEWKPNLSAITDGYKNILVDVYPKQEHSIDVPTLFMKGELSNYIQSEDYALIEKYYNDVQFVTIPNSGHWLHAEQPDLFYDITMDFFA